MATHRYIDKICGAVTALTVLLAVLCMNGRAWGLQAAAKAMGYEERLFDTGRVHTLDIVMDGWDSFLASCEDEEYEMCAVAVDGETYHNVGIRAKGNTSLRMVSTMGSERYSFKLEFDHYDDTQRYHGLDKLSLNNLIQDNTCMKDYLAYRLMGGFGVDAPLCSYVYVTVNGEDWGLYLAVEGVEESFLQRNYGSGYGALYKPDGMELGGGRGNGRNFRMEDFMGQEQAEGQEPPAGRADFPVPESGTVPGTPPGNDGTMPGAPEGMQRPGDMGGGGSGASLQYIDDDPDSYATIFDSAKTDVSDAAKARLIASLKALGDGTALESVLDIDQVLRYFVVHNFVVNGDSYTGSMLHNYYLYEEDGRLSMIPWDYNLAFGGFQGGASSAVNDPIDTPLSVTGDGSRPMADWIFSNDKYTALYHQYFSEFLAGADIDGLIDGAAALIAPYVEKDPTKFCTYEEFETGAAALKEFCRLRTESVQGQLDGSIPSTDDGQSANSAALVDTSRLDLSDMGTMGEGGGRDGFRQPVMGGMSFGEAPAATEEEPDGQPQAETQVPPSEKPRAGHQFQAEPPDNGTPQGSSAILLGISCVLLLGGLLFAIKFKK